MATNKQNQQLLANYGDLAPVVAGIEADIESLSTQNLANLLVTPQTPALALSMSPDVKPLEQRSRRKEPSALRFDLELFDEPVSTSMKVVVTDQASQIVSSSSSEVDDTLEVKIGGVSYTINRVNFEPNNLDNTLFHTTTHIGGKYVRVWHRPPRDAINAEFGTCSDQNCFCHVAEPGQKIPQSEAFFKAHHGGPTPNGATLFGVVVDAFGPAVIALANPVFETVVSKTILSSVIKKTVEYQVDNAIVRTTNTVKTSSYAVMSGGDRSVHTHVSYFNKKRNIRVPKKCKPEYYMPPVIKDKSTADLSNIDYKALKKRYITPCVDHSVTYTFKELKKHVYRSSYITPTVYEEVVVNSEEPDFFYVERQAPKKIVRESVKTRPERVTIRRYTLGRAAKTVVPVSYSFDTEAYKSQLARNNTTLTGPRGRCLEAFFTHVMAIDAGRFLPFDAILVRNELVYTPEVAGKHYIRKENNRDFLLGKYKILYEPEGAVAGILATDKHIKLVSPKDLRATHYLHETGNATLHPDLPENIHNWVIDPTHHTDKDRVYGFNPNEYVDHIQKMVGNIGDQLPLESGNIAYDHNGPAYAKFTATLGGLVLHDVWLPLRHNTAPGAVLGYYALDTASVKLALDTGAVVITYPSAHNCTMSSVHAVTGFAVLDDTFVPYLPIILSSARYKNFDSITLTDSAPTDFVYDNSFGTCCSHNTAAYVFNNMFDEDVKVHEFKASGWDTGKWDCFVTVFMKLCNAYNKKVSLQASSAPDATWRVGTSLYQTDVPTENTVAAYVPGHIMPCDPSGQCSDDGFVGDSILQPTHYYNITTISRKFDFCVVNTASGRKFNDLRCTVVDELGYPIIRKPESDEVIRLCRPVINFSSWSPQIISDVSYTQTLGDPVDPMVLYDEEFEYVLHPFDIDCYLMRTTQNLSKNTFKKMGFSVQEQKRWAKECLCVTGKVAEPGTTIMNMTTLPHTGIPAPVVINKMSTILSDEPDIIVYNVPETFMRNVSEIQHLFGKHVAVKATPAATAANKNSALYQAHFATHVDGDVLHRVIPDDLSSVPSEPESLPIIDVYDALAHRSIRADIKVVAEKLASRESEVVALKAQQAAALVSIADTQDEDVIQQQLYATQNYELLISATTDTLLPLTEKKAQLESQDDAYLQDKEAYKHSWSKTVLGAVVVDVESDIEDEPIPQRDPTVVLQPAQNDRLVIDATPEGASVRVLEVSAVKSESKAYNAIVVDAVKQQLTPADVIVNKTTMSMELPNSIDENVVCPKKTYNFGDLVPSTVADPDLGIQYHNNAYNHQCTLSTLDVCDFTFKPASVRTRVEVYGVNLDIDWPYPLACSAGEVFPRTIASASPSTKVTVNDAHSYRYSTENSFATVVNCCHNCKRTMVSTEKRSLSLLSTSTCSYCSRAQLTLTHSDGVAVVHTDTFSNYAITSLDDAPNIASDSIGPYKLTQTALTYKGNEIVPAAIIAGVYETAPITIYSPQTNDGFTVDGKRVVVPPPASKLRMAIIALKRPSALRDWSYWASKIGTTVDLSFEQNPFPLDVNSSPLWHCDISKNRFSKNLLPTLLNANKDVASVAKSCTGDHIVRVRDLNYTSQATIELLKMHNTPYIYKDEKIDTPVVSARAVTAEPTDRRFDFLALPLMGLLLVLLSPWFAIFFPVYLMYIINNYVASYSAQVKFVKEGFSTCKHCSLTVYAFVRSIPYAVYFNKFKCILTLLLCRSKVILHMLKRASMYAKAATLICVVSTIGLAIFLLWYYLTSTSYASYSFLRHQALSFASIVEACAEHNPDYCVKSPARHYFMWLEDFPEWGQIPSVVVNSFYELKNGAGFAWTEPIVMCAIILLTCLLAYPVAFYLVFNLIVVALVAHVHFAIVTPWLDTTYADVFITLFFSHANVATFVLTALMSRGLFYVISLFHQCRNDLCMVCSDKALPQNTKVPITFNAKVGAKTITLSIKRGLKWCRTHKFYCDHSNIMTPWAAEHLHKVYRINVIPDNCYAIKAMSHANVIAYCASQCINYTTIPTPENYLEESYHGATHINIGSNVLTSHHREIATHMAHISGKATTILMLSEQYTSLEHVEHEDPNTHRFAYKGPIYFPNLKKFLFNSENAAYDDNLDVSDFTFIGSEEGLTKPIYFPITLWNKFKSTTKFELKRVWPHIQTFHDTGYNFSAETPQFTAVPSVTGVSAGTGIGVNIVSNVLPPLVWCVVLYPFFALAFDTHALYDYFIHGQTYFEAASAVPLVDYGCYNNYMDLPINLTYTNDWHCPLVYQVVVNFEGLNCLNTSLTDLCVTRVGENLHMYSSVPQTVLETFGFFRQTITNLVPLTTSQSIAPEHVPAHAVARYLFENQNVNKTGYFGLDTILSAIQPHVPYQSTPTHLTVPEVLAHLYYYLTYYKAGVEYSNTTHVITPTQDMYCVQGSLLNTPTEHTFCYHDILSLLTDLLISGDQVDAIAYLHWLKLYLPITVILYLIAFKLDCSRGYLNSKTGLVVVSLFFTIVRILMAWYIYNNSSILSLAVCVADLVYLWQVSAVLYPSWLLVGAYSLYRCYLHLPILLALLAMIVLYKLYNFYVLRSIDIASLRIGGKYNADFAVCAQHSIPLDIHTAKQLLQDTDTTLNDLHQFASTLPRFRLGSHKSHAIYVQHCKAHLAKHLVDNYFQAHGTDCHTTYYPPQWVTMDTLTTKLQAYTQDKTCVPECQLPSNLEPHIYKVSYTFGTTTTSMTGVHVGDYIYTQRHILGSSTATSPQDNKKFYDDLVAGASLESFLIQNGQGHVLDPIECTSDGMLLKLRVSSSGLVALFSRLTPYTPFTVLNTNQGVALSTSHAYCDEDGFIKAPFTNGSCGSPGFRVDGDGLKIVYFHCMLVSPGRHTGCDGYGLAYGEHFDSIHGAKQSTAVHIYSKLVHTAALIARVGYSKTMTLASFLEACPKNGWTYSEQMQEQFNADCARMAVDPKKVYHAVCTQVPLNHTQLPVAHDSVAPQALVNYTMLQTAVVSYWGSFFIHLVKLVVCAAIVAYATCLIYTPNPLVAAAVTTLVIIFFAMAVKYKVAFLHCVLIPLTVYAGVYIVNAHGLLADSELYYILYATYLVLQIAVILSSTANTFMILLRFVLFTSTCAYLQYAYGRSIEDLTTMLAFSAAAVNSLDTCIFVAFFRPMFHYMNPTFHPYIAVIYCSAFLHFNWIHFINWLVGLKLFNYGVWVSDAQLKYMARNGIKPPQSTLENILFRARLAHVGGKPVHLISRLQATSSEQQVATAAVYQILSHTTKLSYAQQKEICAAFNALQKSPTEQSLLAFIYQAYLNGSEEFKEIITQCFGQLNPDQKDSILQSCDVDPYVKLGELEQELQLAQACFEKDPSQANRARIARVTKDKNRHINEIQHIESEQKKLDKMQRDLLSRLAKEAKTSSTKTTVYTALAQFLGSVLKTMDSEKLITLYKNICPHKPVPLYVLPKYTSVYLDVYVPTFKTFQEYFGSTLSGLKIHRNGATYTVTSIKDSDGKPVDDVEVASYPLRIECKRDSVILQNNEIQNFSMTQTAGTDNNGKQCTVFVSTMGAVSKTAVAAIVRTTDATHFKIGDNKFDLEDSYFTVGTSTYRMVKGITPTQRAAFFVYLNRCSILQSTHCDERECELIKAIYFEMDPAELYLNANIPLQPVPIQATAATPRDGFTEPIVIDTPENFINCNTYAGHTLCVKCIGLHQHECKLRGKWVVMPKSIVDPIRYTLTSELCDSCGSFKIQGRCQCTIPDTTLQYRVTTTAPLIEFTNAVTSALN